MTNSTLEIKNACGGDFSAFSYYGDDYTGERDATVYNSLEEANSDFQEFMSDCGLSALPLENYVNPILD